jgi:hypothetical protein
MCARCVAQCARFAADFADYEKMKRCLEVCADPKRAACLNACRAQDAADFQVELACESACPPERCELRLCSGARPPNSTRTMTYLQLFGGSSVDPGATDKQLADEGGWAPGKWEPAANADGGTP